MSIVSPHTDNNVFENLNNDEMDWTTQKEQLLEDYITNYYQRLGDTRLFYKNLDWKAIYELVGIDDQEFLRLKIDEIYDNSVKQYLGDDFNIDELVLHWKSKQNPIFQEVAQMVESLGLKKFKLDPPQEVETMATTDELNPHHHQQQQHQEQSSLPIPKLEQYREPVQLIKKSESSQVPQLTKTERRLSLELMHPKPMFGVRREFQFSKGPIASTTNINVLAKQESGPVVKKTISPASKKRFSFKLLKPEVTPIVLEPGIHRPKHRRTSTVDEQLPMYIRNQLMRHRPRDKITPKPSKHHLVNNLSNESSIRGSYKKASRLQNLVTNSQSLYAHNKDISNSVKSSPANTFDTDQRRQYFSDESDDDENKEYILPDLLTRYLGTQIGHGDDDVEDDHTGIDTDSEAHEDDDEESNEEDDEEEEEEEDDDHDFVNVGEEDDDDDYLFKI